MTDDWNANSLSTFLTNDAVKIGVRVDWAESGISDSAEKVDSHVLALSSQMDKGKNRLAEGDSMIDGLPSGCKMLLSAENRMGMMGEVSVP